MQSNTDASRPRPSGKAEGAWAGRRVLFLDDKPAFELSFWCGTCQFLFKRQYGAHETVSLAEMEDRLAEGVDDEVVSMFAAASASSATAASASTSPHP